MSLASLKAAVRTMRRRGTFYGALGLVVAGLVIVIVVTTVLWAIGSEHYRGGEEALDAYTGIVWIAAAIGFSLVGAQAGAYDVQRGTFRYLLLAARSKRWLYATRATAVAVLVAAVVVPATAIGAGTALVMPRSEIYDAIEPSDVLLGIWNPLLAGVIYGLIAYAVGALFRSGAVGIAVALFLNLGGFYLLALLALIDERIEKFVLPVAMETLTGADGSIPIAAVTVAAWIAVFLALGAWRTVRDEY